MGLFLNEIIIIQNNHAQEEVFKDLDVEKIVEDVMFEMLNPMLLILIDLIALVD